MVEMIEDLYVSLFVKCKKCGYKINPKDGYYHWSDTPPLKGGYYHPDCGTLNNPKTSGFLPFPP